MMKVKLIVDHKGHLAGQILNLTANEAFGLIDIGAAEKYEAKPASPKRPRRKYKRKAIRARRHRSRRYVTK